MSEGLPDVCYVGELEKTQQHYNDSFKHATLQLLQLSFNIEKRPYDITVGSLSFPLSLYNPNISPLNHHSTSCQKNLGT